MVYFINWQGLKGLSNEEKERAIMEKESQASSKHLCVGLPAEFVSYFRHVESLQHGLTPNYEELRKLVQRMADTHGIKYDGIFDWTVRLYRQQ